MSRNLLHKTKLEDFKNWLDRKGVEHRPGKGDWQILQVKVSNGWQCIFERFDYKMTPQHFTVAAPLESLVHRFIRDSKRETIDD